MALYELRGVAPGSWEVVTCNGDVAAFTVRVAALLVTFATALLTTTVNCPPLSEVVVAEVV
jgi:hypothetical protein